MEKSADIRKDESTVAWFYRLLRNAVVDHYRRRASRARAHQIFAAEIPESYEPEFKAAACECIGEVVSGLKPEYRDAIEQIDLDESSVEAFARSHRISANNASVRLHRARKAVAKHLKAVCGACAEHKCLDCNCRHGKV
jgi:RNA polymerase sigma-70 factor (ECF subfamily)